MNKKRVFNIVIFGPKLKSKRLGPYSSFQEALLVLLKKTRKLSWGNFIYIEPLCEKCGAPFMEFKNGEYVCFNEHSMGKVLIA